MRYDPDLVAMTWLPDHTVAQRVDTPHHRRNFAYWQMGTQKINAFGTEAVQWQLERGRHVVYHNQARGWESIKGPHHGYKRPCLGSALERFPGRALMLQTRDGAHNFHSSETIHKHVMAQPTETQPAWTRGQIFYLILDAILGAEATRRQPYYAAATHEYFPEERIVFAGEMDGPCGITVEAEAQVPESWRRWGKLNTTAAIRRTVRIIHNNLGHPSRTSLLRTLRLADAPEIMTKYAEAWRCPICAANEIPNTPQTVSSRVRPSRFNDTGHADLKWLNDCVGDLYVLLNMICAAVS